jgi:hypothetical protein
VRWKRRRREDRGARLADDVRRAAGFMAFVLQDAERLKVPIPELAYGCVSAWRRWTRHLIWQARTSAVSGNGWSC